MSPSFEIFDGAILRCLSFCASGSYQFGFMASFVAKETLINFG